jgi:molybdopterin/thiamine biosynthesis adenylyltransferase
MIEDDIHSRSRLAGYRPEYLFNANVLIVGAGALGQNLALDLALAGIGELNIVDFDTFEPQNVTRSPLYPNEHERHIWGLEKAKAVAHKLRPLMTAPTPKIRYAVAPIQSLGDLPIAEADIVYAAVDNAEARAYLAERCRITHRPLIEAGFHAEIFTLTVFGPDIADPCYLCVHPTRVGAFSCTRYALQVQQTRAIPAIQNTAAVLAGLQAESGIQWLHGEYSLRNKRVYGNTRTLSMSMYDLPLSSECLGVHQRYINDTPEAIQAQADKPLEGLLRAIEKKIGVAILRFPEPLVIRNFCTRCNLLVDVYVPEWRWLAAPLCTTCGGPYLPANEGSYLSSRTEIHTSNRSEITQLTCTQAGLPGGTIIEVWPDLPQQDSGYLMQMSGTIDQLMIEIVGNDH